MIRSGKSGSNVIDEWWAVPTMKHAIVRQVIYLNKNKTPYMDYDIEYQKLTQGWFPKSWRFDYRRGNGQLLSAEAVQVRAITIDGDIQDAEFTIAELPGVRVKTYLFSKPEAGKLPEPQTRSFLINEAGQRIETTPTVPRSFSPAWWFAIGGGVAFLAASIFFAMRRNRLKAMIAKG